MWKGRRWLVLAALWMGAGSAWAQVDLQPYLRQDVFKDFKISPNGEYLAATRVMEDRTGLVIIRRADDKVTAAVTGRRDSVVDDFWWANDERVVVSLAKRLGALDTPVSIGELHAINVDGSRMRLLASPFGVPNGIGGGISHVGEGVFMVDPTLDSDRTVLVAAMPYESTPLIRLQRLNIYTGDRITVATPPVRRARFTTDPKGQVRFARGAGPDNVSKLYYRDRDDADWRVLNDEEESGYVESALGFSEDGLRAYLKRQQSGRPDAIVEWEPATNQRRVLLQDPVVDPYRIIYSMDGRFPVGASYMHEGVSHRFFDEKTYTARLYRGLEQATDGQAVDITSSTRDGTQALIRIWGDRNNGEYYLFDTAKSKLSFVYQSRVWLDPEALVATESVGFDARDGLRLHGYLTRPKASGDGPLPMVLLPHGGPFGVFDEWAFDTEAQLLAAAGYAVLRVNYRGSGNYGHDYLHAGAREWGGTMQDDLTDATRWAIQQGIADADRICIYGGSYGGYAALMGVAREPGLYRCAVGYVGVYDLPLLHTDLSRDSRSTRTYASEWLGERDQLAARSPVNLAAQIKVPVLLVAGGEDKVAPIAHSERMERALKKQGVPVQTLYVRTEGHGFYTEEHRRQFYTALLDFLADHIGGQPAAH